MKHKAIDEQRHFLSMIELIKENKAFLIRQISEVEERISRLKRSPDKSGKELRNLLTINANHLEKLKQSLKKHEGALDKPYFGRIDYDDLCQPSLETLYIGKSGIARQQDIFIVDWRAPAASIYYENVPGAGSYEVPGVGTVEINLHLKRSYDISGGALRGYYDNDIASNDELLVSYLSRNKDAALGDIIATIQKEQNLIIRQPPFKNMLIQGVAGSGKTTVIMHHLSYVLYNFSKYLQPEERCIIGGNKFLLSYISSGLPELDITHIHAKTMEDFLIGLLDKNWKRNYRLTSPGRDSRYKCRIRFIEALSVYIDEMRAQLLTPVPISDEQLGLLLSEANQAGTIELSRQKSAAQISALINSRILSRPESLIGNDKELLKEKKRQYRNYWKPLSQCPSIVDLYLHFLMDYNREGEGFGQTCRLIAENRFDIYDLAALAFLYRRLTAAKDFDQYRHIIIDETQDFGEALYYVLKHSLDHCHFTLTGDVSQNINYHTGLNHWEVMKEIFLKEEKDSFHLLLKSYRNTIEISALASTVLNHTAARDYAVQPVIRHGKEVSWIKEPEESLLKHCAALIRAAVEEGRRTIAVICRNQEKADKVKAGLAGESLTFTEEEAGFSNGILALPVELTKGLEFDVVILWEPDKLNYPFDEQNANLLYVAVTRALHQLYLLSAEEWSELLSK